MYRNLDQMARGAQDIVYARVSGVRGARSFGLDDGVENAFRAVVFDLEVLEVLSGKRFEENEGVPLEIGLVEFRADVESEFRAVVGDEGLFFLRLKGTAQPEFGVTAVEEEKVLGLYGLVSPQAAFLNDEGRVAIPLFLEPRIFPGELSGTSFQSLVRDVRRAAGS